MSGYDPNFLGTDDESAVPLPTFSPQVQEDVLKRNDLEDDFLATYKHYSLVMSRKFRTALVVAVNVHQDKVQTGLDKGPGWREDTRVGSENQLNNDYYKNNVWDRGHLVRRLDAAWGDTKQEAQEGSDETYYYTNSALQHENFNRDEWVELEDWVMNLDEDSTNQLCVVTGPIFGDFDRTVTPENGRPPAIVPAGFFKIVAYIGKDENKSLQVRAFIMMQDADALGDKQGRNSPMFNFQRYQVSVTEIEELTGLVFAAHLKDRNPIHVGEHIEVDGQDEIVVDIDEERIDVEDVPVYVAAALVNPATNEAQGEWVSIINLSNQDVDLNGWTLRDPQDQLPLAGTLTPGQAVQVKPLRPISLANKGGSISLFRGETRIDRVKYPTQGSILEGKPVVFFWRTPTTVAE